MGNTNTNTRHAVSSTTTEHELPIATIASEMAARGEEYLEIRNYVCSIIGRSLTANEKKRLKLGVHVTINSASEKMEDEEDEDDDDESSSTAAAAAAVVTLRSRSGQVAASDGESEGERCTRRKRSSSDPEVQLRGVQLFHRALSAEEEEEKEEEGVVHARSSSKSKSKSQSKKEDKKENNVSQETSQEMKKLEVEEEDDWLLLSTDVKVYHNNDHRNPLSMARFGLSDRAVYTRTVSVIQVQIFFFIFFFLFLR